MATFGDPNARGRRWRDRVLPGRATRERRAPASRVDWLGAKYREKDWSGLSARERAAAEAGDWNRWVGRDKPTPEKNWNSLMGRAARAGVIGSHTEPGR